MSFKNSKILVVGGAGFVGSNLVHKLLQEAPREIIVVDNLLSADMVNVPKDVRFILGSIAMTHRSSNLSWTWTIFFIFLHITAINPVLPIPFKTTPTIPIPP